MSDVDESSNFFCARLSPEEYERQKEETTKTELAKLHKQLKKQKEEYVKPEDIEDDSEDSDSLSESENIIPTITLRKRGRKNSKAHKETLFLYQELTEMQKKVFKHVKAVSKAQREYDRVELELHYTRLDLNTAKEEAEEKTRELEQLNKINFNSRVENWIWRFLMLLFLFYQISVTLTS